MYSYLQNPNLDILIKYSKPIKYHDITVNVPEPSAYVINKLITSMRRDNKDKKDKDLKSAKEIGEYILKDPIQKKLLVTIFNSYGKKTKRIILDTVKKHSQKLYALFNE